VNAPEDRLGSEAVCTRKRTGEVQRKGPITTAACLYAATSPAVLGGHGAARLCPPYALRRLLLPKERGHPRDLKRKVENDRKDREGD